MTNLTEEVIMRTTVDIDVELLDQLARMRGVSRSEILNEGMNRVLAAEQAMAAGRELVRLIREVPATEAGAPPRRRF
jgi:hypothetical protein